MGGEYVLMVCDSPGPEHLEVTWRACLCNEQDYKFKHGFCFLARGWFGWPSLRRHKRFSPRSPHGHAKLRATLPTSTCANMWMYQCSENIVGMVPVNGRRRSHSSKKLLTPPPTACWPLATWRAATVAVRARPTLPAASPPSLMAACAARASGA